MRQLQVFDGIALNEWNGSGSGPVAPNGWTFVDVTDRPDAQVGMAYDAATDTFTAISPSLGQRDLEAPNTDTTLRDIANDLRAIKATLGI